MAKLPGSYIQQLLSDGVDGLTELFNINPDRVDLVAFPAIGRKFLLVKANFSNADWDSISESDYTVDQLARAVPSAIREWAIAQAEKEGRNIISGDLKLRYKDPSGCININGVSVAKGLIEQVEGVPHDVIVRAGAELDSVWNKIQKLNINKEDNNMDEVVKSIEGYIGKLNSGKAGSIQQQLKEILGNISKNIQDGNVSVESVSGLLDELKAAFGDGNTVSKSFFANWSSKVEEFAKKFDPKKEEEDEEEEEEEDSVTKGEATVVQENNDGAVQKSEETSVAAETAVGKNVESTEASTVIVEAQTPQDTAVEKSAETATPVADIKEEAAVASDASEDVVKSIREQLAKSQADLAQAREDVRKAQEEIQKARDEQLRLSFISKAGSELKYIGKSADSMADILIRLRKSGVPQVLFDEIYDLLKSANEMIDKSGFFSEKGTEASDDSGDPDSRLMKSAERLVKEGKHATVEQAYVALLREDPSILTRE